MAFSAFKILKGLLISEEATLTPKQIEITPAGSASTKTSIVSSQTGNVTLTLPNATDTLVGKATTDVLTNKTLTGNIAVNLISGAATITLPVSSSDLATLALAETLTNKTLTAPVINSPTGIVKGDVGLGNVDNTSDATKNAAAVSLTNKTIDADLNTITNIENADIKAGAAIDASKLADGTVSNAEFQRIGALGSTAVGISDSQVLTNKTIDADLNTLSNIENADIKAGAAIDAAKIADGTVSNTEFQRINALGSAAVGISDTQVLTNKDIDGGTASNTSRLTVPKDTKANLDALTRKEATVVYASDLNRLYADDGSNLISIGSSSGAINFISNPDAEIGTTDWVVDSFAAASRPAGALTGTTTGITFAASSSAPLAGVNSFTLAKDAANRQGRVVYTGITLTPAYFAKVLNISMDYIVSSGTFVAGAAGVDSDVIPYIQNVTDGTFIEPSSFKFLSNSSTISDHFSATFQTAPSATSYRLLLYFPTTSASAFTLKLDNIAVSPSNYVFGTPITDWVACTFTGSWIANTVYTARKRRVGDNYEYNVKVALSGAPTSAVLSLNLPTGDVIDTNKLPTGTAIDFDSATDGDVHIFAGSAWRGRAHMTNSGGTAVALTYADTNGNFGFITQAQPATFGNGHIVIAIFKVPIVGLSSSVQMSDSADTRVVSFSGNTTAGTSIPTSTYTNVPFTTVEDSHGAWNGTQYLIKVSGIYSLASTLQYASASWTQGRYNIIGVYKNGALYRNSTNYIQYTASQVPNSMVLSVEDIPCLVGDTLEIRTAQNEGTRSLGVSAEEQFLTISRVSGPSAIAASEDYNLRYIATSGQTFAGGTTTVSYPTKFWDSHNSFSSNTTFTAQTSGKYRVNSQVIIPIVSGLGTCNITINKNGSPHSVKIDAKIFDGFDHPFCIQDTVQMLAGDTVTISVLNGGTSQTADTTAGANFLSIEKVGNY